MIFHLGALGASACGIGGESFLAWVSEFYGKMAENKKRPEDISLRNVIERQNPEEVLNIVGAIIRIEVGEFKTRRRDARARALASYYLTCYAGLTQREVAEYLNVGTGSSVGKQMKKLVNDRGNDRKLAKLMETMEGRLSHTQNVVAGDR